MIDVNEIEQRDIPARKPLNVAENSPARSFHACYSRLGFRLIDRERMKTSIIVMRELVD
jgi:hypothetical protein